MSAAGLAAIAALSGVLVTALVTWLVNARKLSGDITTSDAEQLWTESRSVRDLIREQLLEASKRIVELEARVALCEREHNGLARENLDLRRQLLEQERRNAELKDRVAELYRDLQQRHGEQP